MITVEQAKKKLCPADRNGVSNCIADDCMAWRWFDPEFAFKEFRKIELPQAIIDLVANKGSAKAEEKIIQKQKPEGEEWRFDYEDFCWFRHHPEKRRGFCGLAGGEDIRW